jgi:hypothetical protein
MPSARVLAPENCGPSVVFRLYDPATVSDPDAEFEYECEIQNSDEYLNRLERNNAFHRQLYLDRGKIGLFTNWIEFAAHTEYDEKGRFHKLPGEKAVFMNPMTSRDDIDLFLENAMHRKMDVETELVKQGW